MPAPTRGYAHGEAYKVMKYASDDGKLVERIWNSRDGVTPFIVRSADGVEMKHVDWPQDVYQPFWPHVRAGLKVGDRIFVDMTREEAEKAGDRIRSRWVEKHGIYLRARWHKHIEAHMAQTDDWGMTDAVKHHFATIIEHRWSDDRTGAEERARLAAHIDRSVAYPGIPAPDDWDEIIEAQVEQMCEPGSPHLVTVDEAMLTHLRRHIPLPSGRVT